MAEIEDDIRALGIETIWVLEQNTVGADGTAEDCLAFKENRGSVEGWCVGDGATQPVPGTFDDSPFSIGRGFDILVPRDTMEVVYTTNHGTPSGNTNLTAAELLAEIEAAMEAL